MKNKILAVILGATSTMACAQQDNTQEMMKDAICQNVARFAALGYSSRATHRRHELEQDLHLDNDYMKPINIWAFNFGRDLAPTELDAQKVGYAKCLDKMDRAALHAKEGLPPMTLDEVNQMGD
jgi:hypothetical protein